MRYSVCMLALMAGANAWGQMPPTPSPQMKATPQPQQPQTQLYRLVPVESPPTQQYQTVQAPQYQTVQQPQYQTVQVQQPVYQTVQVAQPQQYQTVQMVQQPIQQAMYTSAMSTTMSIAPVGEHTIVLGPGLVGLSLARTGQFMVQHFGKSHVWNIQHTTVRPQMMQTSSPVQLVSVSIPQTVAQPPVQMQLMQAPQQPQQQQQMYRINAPSEEAPPPPIVPVHPPKPSPQSSAIPAPKRLLFGMLGG